MAHDPQANEENVVFSLANRLLDEPNCDPDDDLRMLSRQLIRRHEEISRLREALTPFAKAAIAGEKRYQLLLRAEVGVMDCCDGFIDIAKRWLSVANFRDALAALQEAKP